MGDRETRVGEAGDRQFFSRNQEIRRARLRSDAERPPGELLAEAMRLSAFAVDLKAGGRRARP